MVHRNEFEDFGSGFWARTVRTRVPSLSCHRGYHIHGDALRRLQLLREFWVWALQGAFTAKFSFDTSTTGLSEKVSGPFENYLQGGSFLGTNSPALSASITINGITETFVNPNLFGFIYGWNHGVNSSQIHQAAVANDVFLYARIEAKNAALPATIDLPFTYTVQDGDNAQGSFQTASAKGKLNITSMTETVEEIPAVPEPATWVMMILGFCGLGCMAYRRKSSAMIHA